MAMRTPIADGLSWRACPESNLSELASCTFQRRARIHRERAYAITLWIQFWRPRMLCASDGQITPLMHGQITPLMQRSKGLTTHGSQAMCLDALFMSLPLLSRLSPIVRSW